MYLVDSFTWESLKEMMMEQMSLGEKLHLRAGGIAGVRGGEVHLRAGGGVGVPGRQLHLRARGKQEYVIDSLTEMEQVSLMDNIT